MELWKTPRRGALIVTWESLLSDDSGPHRYGAAGLDPWRSSTLDQPRQKGPPIEQGGRGPSRWALCGWSVPAGVEYGPVEDVDVAGIQPGDRRHGDLRRQSEPPFGAATVGRAQCRCADRAVRGRVARSWPRSGWLGAEVVQCRVVQFGFAAFQIGNEHVPDAGVADLVAIHHVIQRPSYGQ